MSGGAIGARRPRGPRVALGRLALTALGLAVLGSSAPAEALTLGSTSAASRTALLTGRLMRDMLQLLVQALILVVLGYLMGMRGSVIGVILGIIITMLIGGACAAASNALALTTKSEDVMAPLINMVMMPVLLLSGILLPMTLGPSWLQSLSDFMPFRWIVDAVRDTFSGDLASAQVLWGVLASLILAGLGTLWGTSVFRKENA